MAPCRLKGSSTWTPEISKGFAATPNAQTKLSNAVVDCTLNDLRDIFFSSLLGFVVDEASVVLEAWASHEVVMIDMEIKDTQRINT